VKSNSIEVKQNTGSNCPNSVIYMWPIFLWLIMSPFLYLYMQHFKLMLNLCLIN